MNPAQAKSVLRREALARRADVDPSLRETFAARLATQGIEIARRSCAHTVSAYWPIGAEADTRFLLQALVYHEFTAALPVVVGRRRPLVFRRWQLGQSMVQQGAMGLFEPPATSPEIEPALLFVPLAGFDRSGHRLGYGAGYYDCTLSWLRIRSPIITVGIGFACQEIPAIPSEDHDQPLDFVITETEVIACQAAGTDP